MKRHFGLWAAFAFAFLSATAHAALLVPDNYRPLRYSASENQRQFEVTWPFEVKADVHVLISADGGATFTAKTLDTDFTVTGAGTCGDLEAQECGGNIKFVAAHCDDNVCGTAPCYCSADVIVIIYRDDAVDRPVNMTSVTPEAVNLHLNRHTIELQQNEDFAESRAVQAPIDNDYHNSEFSPVLPQVNAAVVGKAIVVKPNHCRGHYDVTCTTNGDCEGTDQCLPTGFTFGEIAGSAGATGPTGPQGPAGANGSNACDIHIGVMEYATDAYTIFFTRFARACSFPPELEGSRIEAYLNGANATAVVTFNKIASADCNPNDWNPVAFATGTFFADPTVTEGAFDTANGVTTTFNVGDCMEVVAPDPADETLGPYAIWLKGELVTVTTTTTTTTTTVP